MSKSIYILVFLTSIAYSNVSKALTIDFPQEVYLLHDSTRLYARVPDSTRLKNVYVNGSNAWPVYSWRLSLVDGDWFEVRSTVTQRVMTVDGGNIVANLHNPNLDSQKWKFVREENCKESREKCYRLKNKSGKYASVVNKGDSPSVVARPNRNDKKQLWEVIIR